MEKDDDANVESKEWTRIEEDGRNSDQRGAPAMEEAVDAVAGMAPGTESRPDSGAGVPESPPISPREAMAPRTAADAALNIISTMMNEIRAASAVNNTVPHPAPTTCPSRFAVPSSGFPDAGAVAAASIVAATHAVPYAPAMLDAPLPKHVSSPSRSEPQAAEDLDFSTAPEGFSARSKSSTDPYADVKTLPDDALSLGLPAQLVRSVTTLPPAGSDPGAHTASLRTTDVVDHQSCYSQSVSETLLERSISVVDYEAPEEAHEIVDSALEKILDAVFKVVDKSPSDDVTEVARTLLVAAVDAAIARACLSSEFSTEYAYDDVLSCVSAVAAETGSLSGDKGAAIDCVHHESSVKICLRKNQSKEGIYSEENNGNHSDVSDCENMCSWEESSEWTGFPLRPCPRFYDLTKTVEKLKEVVERAAAVDALCEEAAELLLQIVEPTSEDCDLSPSPVSLVDIIVPNYLHPTYDRTEEKPHGYSSTQPLNKKISPINNRDACISIVPPQERDNNSAPLHLLSSSNPGDENMSDDSSAALLDVIEKASHNLEISELFKLKFSETFLTRTSEEIVNYDPLFSEDTSNGDHNNKNIYSKLKSQNNDKQKYWVNRSLENINRNENNNVTLDMRENAVVKIQNNNELNRTPRTLSEKQVYQIKPQSMVNIELLSHEDSNRKDQFLLLQNKCKILEDGVDIVYSPGFRNDNDTNEIKIVNSGSHCRNETLSGLPLVSRNMHATCTETKHLSIDDECKASIDSGRLSSREAIMPLSLITPEFSCVQSSNKNEINCNDFTLQYVQANKPFLKEEEDSRAPLKYENAFPSTESIKGIGEIKDNSCVKLHHKKKKLYVAGTSTDGDEILNADEISCDAAANESNKHYNRKYLSDDIQTFTCGAQSNTLESECSVVEDIAKKLADNEHDERYLGRNENTKYVSDDLSNTTFKRIPSNVSFSTSTERSEIYVLHDIRDTTVTFSEELNGILKNSNDISLVSENGTSTQDPRNKSKIMYFSKMNREIAHALANEEVKHSSEVKLLTADDECKENVRTVKINDTLKENERIKYESLKHISETREIINIQAELEQASPTKRLNVKKSRETNEQYTVLNRQDTFNISPSDRKMLDITQCAYSSTDECEQIQSANSKTSTLLLNDEDKILKKVYLGTKHLREHSCLRSKKSKTVIVMAVGNGRLFNTESKEAFTDFLSTEQINKDIYGSIPSNNVINSSCERNMEHGNDFKPKDINIKPTDPQGILTCQSGSKEEKGGKPFSVELQLYSSDVLNSYKGPNISQKTLRDTRNIKKEAVSETCGTVSSKNLNLVNYATKNYNSMEKLRGEHNLPEDSENIKQTSNTKSKKNVKLRSAITSHSDASHAKPGDVVEMSTYSHETSVKNMHSDNELSHIPKQTQNITETSSLSTVTRELSIFATTPSSKRFATRSRTSHNELGLSKSRLTANSGSLQSEELIKTQAPYEAQGERFQSLTTTKPAETLQEKNDETDDETEDKPNEMSKINLDAQVTSSTKNAVTYFATNEILSPAKNSLGCSTGTGLVGSCLGISDGSGEHVQEIRTSPSLSLSLELGQDGTNIKSKLIDEQNEQLMDDTSANSQSSLDDSLNVRLNRVPGNIIVTWGLTEQTEQNTKRKSDTSLRHDKKLPEITALSQEYSPLFEPTCDIEKYYDTNKNIIKESLKNMICVTVRHCVRQKMKSSLREWLLDFLCAEGGNSNNTDRMDIPPKVIKEILRLVRRPVALNHDFIGVKNYLKTSIGEHQCKRRSDAELSVCSTDDTGNIDTKIQKTEKCLAKILDQLLMVSDGLQYSRNHLRTIVYTFCCSFTYTKGNNVSEEIVGNNVAMGDFLHFLHETGHDNLRERLQQINNDSLEKIICKLLNKPLYLYMFMNKGDGQDLLNRIYEIVSESIQNQLSEQNTSEINKTVKARSNIVHETHIDQYVVNVVNEEIRAEAKLKEVQIKRLRVLLSLKKKHGIRTWLQTFDENTPERYEITPECESFNDYESSFQNSNENETIKGSSSNVTQKNTKTLDNADSRKGFREIIADSSENIQGGNLETNEEDCVIKEDEPTPTTDCQNFLADNGEQNDIGNIDVDISIPQSRVGHEEGDNTISIIRQISHPKHTTVDDEKEDEIKKIKAHISPHSSVHRSISSTTLAGSSTQTCHVFDRPCYAAIPRQVTFSDENNIFFVPSLTNSVINESCSREDRTTTRENSDKLREEEADIMEKLYKVLAHDSKALKDIGVAREESKIARNVWINNIMNETKCASHGDQNYSNGHSTLDTKDATGDEIEKNTRILSDEETDNGSESRQFLHEEIDADVFEQYQTDEESRQSHLLEFVRPGIHPGGEEVNEEASEMRDWLEEYIEATVAARMQSHRRVGSGQLIETDRRLHYRKEREINSFLTPDKLTFQDCSHRGGRNHSVHPDAHSTTCIRGSDVALWSLEDNYEANLLQQGTYIVPNEEGTKDDSSNSDVAESSNKCESATTSGGGGEAPTGEELLLQRFLQDAAARAGEPEWRAELLVCLRRYVAEAIEHCVRRRSSSLAGIRTRGMLSRSWSQVSRLENTGGRLCTVTSGGIDEQTKLELREWLRYYVQQRLDERLGPIIGMPAAVLEGENTSSFERAGSLPSINVRTSEQTTRNFSMQYKIASCIELKNTSSKEECIQPKYQYDSEISFASSGETCSVNSYDSYEYSFERNATKESHCDRSTLLDTSVVEIPSQQVSWPRDILHDYECNTSPLDMINRSLSSYMNMINENSTTSVYNTDNMHISRTGSTNSYDDRNFSNIIIDGEGQNNEFSFTKVPPVNQTLFGEVNNNKWSYSNIVRTSYVNSEKSVSLLSSSSHIVTPISQSVFSMDINTLENNNNSEQIHSDEMDKKCFQPSQICDKRLQDRTSSEELGVILRAPSRVSSEISTIASVPSIGINATLSISSCPSTARRQNIDDNDPSKVHARKESHSSLDDRNHNLNFNISQQVHDSDSKQSSQSNQNISQSSEHREEKSQDSSENTNSISHPPSSTSHRTTHSHEQTSVTFQRIALRVGSATFPSSARTSDRTHISESYIPKITQSRTPSQETCNTEAIQSGRKRSNVGAAQIPVENGTINDSCCPLTYSLKNISTNKTYSNVNQGPHPQTDEYKKEHLTQPYISKDTLSNKEITRVGIDSSPTIKENENGTNTQETYKSQASMPMKLSSQSYSPKGVHTKRSPSKIGSAPYPKEEEKEEESNATEPYSPKGVNTSKEHSRVGSGPYPAEKESAEESEPNKPYAPKGVDTKRPPSKIGKGPYPREKEKEEEANATEPYSPKGVKTSKGHSRVGSGPYPTKEESSGESEPDEPYAPKGVDTKRPPSTIGKGPYPKEKQMKEEENVTEPYSPKGVKTSKGHSRVGSGPYPTKEESAEESEPNEPYAPKGVDTKRPPSKIGKGPYPKEEEKKEEANATEPYSPKGVYSKRSPSRIGAGPYPTEQEKKEETNTKEPHAPKGVKTSKAHLHVGSCPFQTNEGDIEGTIPDGLYSLIGVCSSKTGSNVVTGWFSKDEEGILTEPYARIGITSTHVPSRAVSGSFEVMGGAFEEKLIESDSPHYVDAKTSCPCVNGTFPGVKGKAIGRTAELRPVQCSMSKGIKPVLVGKCSEHGTHLDEPSNDIESKSRGDEVFSRFKHKGQHVPENEYIFRGVERTPETTHFSNDTLSEINDRRVDGDPPTLNEPRKILHNNSIVDHPCFLGNCTGDERKISTSSIVPTHLEARNASDSEHTCLLSPITNSHNSTYVSDVGFVKTSQTNEPTLIGTFTSPYHLKENICSHELNSDASTMIYENSDPSTLPSNYFDDTVLKTSINLDSPYNYQRSQDDNIISPKRSTNIWSPFVSVTCVRSIELNKTSSSDFINDKSTDLKVANDEYTNNKITFYNRTSNRLNPIEKYSIDRYSSEKALGNPNLKITDGKQGKIDDEQNFYITADTDFHIGAEATSETCSVDSVTNGMMHVENISSLPYSTNEISKSNSPIVVENSLGKDFSTFNQGNRLDDMINSDILLMSNNTICNQESPTSHTSSNDDNITISITANASKIQESQTYQSTCDSLHHFTQLGNVTQFDNTLDISKVETECQLIKSESSKQSDLFKSNNTPFTNLQIKDISCTKEESHENKNPQNPSADCPNTLRKRHDSEPCLHDNDSDDENEEHHSQSNTAYEDFNAMPLASPLVGIMTPEERNSSFLITDHSSELSDSSTSNISLTVERIISPPNNIPSSLSSLISLITRMPIGSMLPNESNITTENSIGRRTGNLMQPVSVQNILQGSRLSGIPFQLQSLSLGLEESESRLMDDMQNDAMGFGNEHGQDLEESSSNDPITIDVHLSWIAVHPSFENDSADHPQGMSNDVSSLHRFSNFRTQGYDDNTHLYNLFDDKQVQVLDFNVDMDSSSIMGSSALHWQTSHSETETQTTGEQTDEALRTSDGCLLVLPTTHSSEDIEEDSVSTNLPISVASASVDDLLPTRLRDNIVDVDEYASAFLPGMQGYWFDEHGRIAAQVHGNARPVPLHDLIDDTRKTVSEHAEPTTCSFREAQCMSDNGFPVDPDAPAIERPLPENDFITVNPTPTPTTPPTLTTFVALAVTSDIPNSTSDSSEENPRNEQPSSSNNDTGADDEEHHLAQALRQEQHEGTCTRLRAPVTAAASRAARARTENLSSHITSTGVSQKPDPPPRKEWEAEEFDVESKYESDSEEDEKESNDFASVTEQNVFNNLNQQFIKDKQSIQQEYAPKPVSDVQIIVNSTCDNRNEGSQAFHATIYNPHEVTPTVTAMQRKSGDDNINVLGKSISEHQHLTSENMPIFHPDLSEQKGLQQQKENIPGQSNDDSQNNTLTLNIQRTSAANVVHEINEEPRVEISVTTHVQQHGNLLDSPDIESQFVSQQEPLSIIQTRASMCNENTINTIGHSSKYNEQPFPEAVSESNMMRECKDENAKDGNVNANIINMPDEEENAMDKFKNTKLINVTVENVNTNKDLAKSSQQGNSVNAHSFSMQMRDASVVNDLVNNILENITIESIVNEEFIVSFDIDAHVNYDDEGSVHACITEDKTENIDNVRTGAVEAIPSGIFATNAIIESGIGPKATQKRSTTQNGIKTSEPISIDMPETPGPLNDTEAEHVIFNSSKIKDCGLQSDREATLKKEVKIDLLPLPVDLLAMPGPSGWQNKTKIASNDILEGVKTGTYLTSEEDDESMSDSYFLGPTKDKKSLTDPDNSVLVQHPKECLQNDDKPVWRNDMKSVGYISDHFLPNTEHVSRSADRAHKERNLKTNYKPDKDSKVQSSVPLPQTIQKPNMSKLAAGQKSVPQVVTTTAFRLSTERSVPAADDLSPERKSCADVPNNATIRESTIFTQLDQRRSRCSEWETAKSTGGNIGPETDSEQEEDTSKKKNMKFRSRVRKFFAKTFSMKKKK